MTTAEEKLAAGAIVKLAMDLPFAHQLRFAARLAADPRVPWYTRVPLVGLLLYLAMPLDIIPDFIPIIGQLDDLLVAGVAVWWFVRTCPPSLANEHLNALRRTPLGRFDRALPWLVGASLVAAALLIVAVRFGRRAAAR